MHQPPAFLFFLSRLTCLSIWLCSWARYITQCSYTQTNLIVTSSMVFTFIPVFSCSTSPAVFSDGDMVKKNNFINSHCYVCADQTAVQTVGEIRRDRETLSSPPLFQSLITYCGSSLHLALLQIPSLPLCLSFSLSPSLLRSPSISLAEDTPSLCVCVFMYVCGSPCELHVSVFIHMWLRSWREGLMKCSGLGYQILLLMHIYHNNTLKYSH